MSNETSDKAVEMPDTSRENASDALGSGRLGRAGARVARWFRDKADLTIYRVACATFGGLSLGLGMGLFILFVASVMGSSAVPPGAESLLGKIATFAGSTVALTAARSVLRLLPPIHDGSDEKERHDAARRLITFGLFVAGLTLVAEWVAWRDGWFPGSTVSKTLGQRLEEVEEQERRSAALVSMLSVQQGRFETVPESTRAWRTFAAVPEREYKVELRTGSFAQNIRLELVVLTEDGHILAGRRMPSDSHSMVYVVTGKGTTSLAVGFRWWREKVAGSSPDEEIEAFASVSASVFVTLISSPQKPISLVGFDAGAPGTMPPTDAEPASMAIRARDQSLTIPLCGNGPAPAKHLMLDAASDGWATVTVESPRANVALAIFESLEGRADMRPVECNAQSLPDTRDQSVVWTNEITLYVRRGRVPIVILGDDGGVGLKLRWSLVQVPEVPDVLLGKVIEVDMLGIPARGKACGWPSLRAFDLPVHVPKSNTSTAYRAQIIPPRSSPIALSRGRLEPSDARLQWSASGEPGMREPCRLSTKQSVKEGTVTLRIGATGAVLPHRVKVRVDEAPPDEERAKVLADLCARAIPLPLGKPWRSTTLKATDNIAIVPQGGARSGHVVSFDDDLRSIGLGAGDLFAKVSAPPGTPVHCTFDTLGRPVDFVIYALNKCEPGAQVSSLGAFGDLDFTIPATGSVVVVVDGETRDDRGAFSVMCGRP